jgi:ribulose-phosphate 3-epimerase
VRIYPSIMGKSQNEINLLFKKLEDVSEYVHLDVADGKFVPNKSLWFKFRLSSKFTYAAHLMIKNPISWVKKNCGRFSVILFHPEVLNLGKSIELIKNIKTEGKKVGIALKPETKVSSVTNLLDLVDYVLILTVHPGFYGAKYLKNPLKKIKQIKKNHPTVKVIVDGHMNPVTIKEAKKAGADIIISGSFLSKSDNPKKAMKELKKSLL